MSKKAPSYLKTAVLATRKAARRISRDCVLAYAGQASFFLVISAIPFFLLLSSMLRILLPAYLPLSADFLFEILPEASVQVLMQIYADLGREANVPILSVTALVLLWASSRGVRSLSEGIRNIYGTRLMMSWIRKYLHSLLTTLFVMLSIACLVFLMLFRNYLVDEVLGIPSAVLGVLSGVRFLFVIAFLSVIFALLFAFEIFKAKKERSDQTEP